ncbi:MAG: ABC transporter substrate-binding protein [Clostridiales bacterium]|nr:ABC transporter substrate-binding protein [Clostridiales bacterium]
MRNRNRLLSLLMLLLLLTAAACGPAPSPAADNHPAQEEAAPSLFPVTVTDDLGQELTFTQPPQRIGAFVPSATDLLLTLGMKDRIAVVDPYSAAQFPEVEGITQMDTYNIDFEFLVAQKLDLILTLPGQYLDRMRELGLKVYVLQPSDIEGVYRNFLNIGKVAGIPDTADEVVKGLRQAMQPILEKVARIPEDQRVTVYAENWNDPIYAAGAGSYTDALIRAAGGKNILHDSEQPWPQVNAEDIIARAPEVILVTAGNPGGEELVKGTRPGWESVPAVVNRRVYVVPDELISQPGSRVAEAVQFLYQLFYEGEGR